MIINSKSFIGVPVVTESGVLMGKVGSIDFDSENGRFTGLHVRSRSVVSALSQPDLLIAWHQILSITDTEVRVKDTSVNVANAHLALSPT